MTTPLSAPRSGRLLASALAAALVACGTAKTTAADSAGTAAPATIPAPLATPTTGGADTATLSTPQGKALVRADSAPGAVDVLTEPLQWTADDVVARLREAGLAPVLQGTVQQPAFGTPGLRLLVARGAGKVQAFIFGDPGAVGIATRAFNTGRGAAATAAPTSLAVDNNLAAIILTRDEKLRARIHEALTARRGEGR